MGAMSEALDYKSPEQVRGEDFNTYSDLWQLVGRLTTNRQGVLTLHLLTGVPPFKKKFRASIDFAITN